MENLTAFQAKKKNSMQLLDMRALITIDTNNQKNQMITTIVYFHYALI